YAHQNLIVHRDLKPSNILVTDDPGSGPGQAPQVKLLDFGIAKLLGENTPDAVPMTRTGMRAMTPEYASPEQVRGETVTTASDVYALGVVLYELLTGQRPYQVRNLSSTRIEQIICETEPPKPSTAIAQPAEADSQCTPVSISQARRTQPERLHRRLRGDLDIIVMAALRKEPARRYSSAQQFSEDIRRHLVQLPITARPETLRYQVSTFVRRHTVGVVATGLVLLALVGGIVATAHQASVAASERDRAEQRFDDVRSLANTMLFDLHDAIRDLPGATPARQMLVRQAHAYLDTLARDVTPDPTLQRELAEAYTRVGEIQGDPHFPNLGDITAATASYEAALDLRQTLWQQDSTDTDARHALADSYGRLAVVKSWGGANAEAITLSQRALDLMASLDATNEQVRHDKGRIYSELGWWYVWAGQPADGLIVLALADSLLAPLATTQPHNLDLQIDYWRVFAYRSDAHWFSDNLEEALRILQEESLPHTQATVARFPGNPRAQGSLSTNLHKMAHLHQLMGQYDEALAMYQSSLPIAEAGVVADSADSRKHGGVAGIHHAMGEILIEQNKLREARAHLEQALAIRQRLYERDSDHGEHGYAVASSLRTLCELLRKENHLRVALAYCEQAATIQEAAVVSDAQNAIGQEALYDISVMIARIHADLTRQTLAGEPQREHLRASLDWYDRSLTLIEKLEAQGVTYTWNTPPDTVAAERATLADL
ncbi:MAG TPA: serine/threonine-protein kinase, partial [Rhodothermales bacterium]|nr:serine/threonine-protein kinase [Rhodothermales bacterium]